MFLMCVRLAEAFFVMLHCALDFVSGFFCLRLVFAFHVVFTGCVQASVDQSVAVFCGIALLSVVADA